MEEGGGGGGNCLGDQLGGSKINKPWNRGEGGGRKIWELSQQAFMFCIRKYLCG